MGKLGMADLTGGTFSISNIGVVGGTYLNPVVVVPEVRRWLSAMESSPETYCAEELQHVTSSTTSRGVY